MEFEGDERLGLGEEGKGRGAGGAPRDRAPRRNVRRADDHDDADDDDNGERELRSGAVDAARPRVEWTGAGGRADGGNEARAEERREGGGGGKAREGTGSCKQALVSLKCLLDS